jgi:hypothetical protein
MTPEPGRAASRFAGCQPTRTGWYAPQSNGWPPTGVYWIVTKRFLGIATVLSAALLAAAYDPYISAQQKLDQIEGDKLRPGARITLTPQELDAWVAHEAPAGVRNPHLELTSPGMATGTALIDFGKVRRAQGHPPGWLMSRLLDGERPVSVTARIRSGGGQATVDVQRVAISGLEIDGQMLDFLIQNFLLALYPDAAVGRPFDLGHRVEKIDVARGSVGVLIGK